MLEGEMTMSLEDDNHLAVIDEDAKKKLDGSVGAAVGPSLGPWPSRTSPRRPTRPHPRSRTCSGLANKAQLQGSLEQSLAELSGVGSLVELSHPSSSCFVSGVDAVAPSSRRRAAQPGGRRWWAPAAAPWGSWRAGARCSRTALRSARLPPFRRAPQRA